MKKVVVVTGVSSGLGRAFAEALLNADFAVVGTVRKQEDAQAFEELRLGPAFGRVFDVTEPEDKAIELIQGIEQHVGPVYALINNAGYGHEGTLERSTMQELRQQFEVNVFGAASLMKAVLPRMRGRREGRIVNVTSMGGLMTLPGLSLYHGSKFALEGISASLGKEVKQFGIHVTAVEPGQFRTDWAGRSMVRSERTISDYDALFDPIREARNKKSGHQQGDPAKAGQALTVLLNEPNPPAHLLLGTDASEYVLKEFKTIEAEFAEWNALTASTDFATS